VILKALIALRRPLHNKPKGREQMKFRTLVFAACMSLSLCPMSGNAFCIGEKNSFQGVEHFEIAMDVGQSEGSPHLVSEEDVLKTALSVFTDYGLKATQFNPSINMSDELGVVKCIIIIMSTYWPKEEEFQLDVQLGVWEKASPTSRISLADESINLAACTWFCEEVMGGTAKDSSEKLLSTVSELTEKLAKKVIDDNRNTSASRVPPTETVVPEILREDTKLEPTETVVPEILREGTKPEPSVKIEDRVSTKVISKTSDLLKLRLPWWSKPNSWANTLFHVKTGFSYYDPGASEDEFDQHEKLQEFQKLREKSKGREQTCDSFLVKLSLNFSDYLEDYNFESGSYTVRIEGRFVRDARGHTGSKIEEEFASSGLSTPETDYWGPSVEFDPRIETEIVLELDETEAEKLRDLPPVW
jgi:hypothetical protein